MSLSKYYEIGKLYEFEIHSIEQHTNKTGKTNWILTVLDKEQNPITVKGLPWQNKDIWTFSQLICLVENITPNESLRLINKDYRHPIFKIGGEYEFEIIGHKVTKTEKRDYDVIELRGIDNCLHRVNMLPGQGFINKDLKKITCLIKDITTHIKLIQISKEDPFFVSFEEIIKDKQLSKKYFHNFLDSDYNRDESISQIKIQYESKAAFWVFTYADKFLRNQFKESITKLDFISAIEINSLIIEFENWIIHSGIITSFRNDHAKQKTKQKATYTLESATLDNNVLNLLNSRNFNFFQDRHFFKQDEEVFEKLNRVLKYCDFKIADIFEFYNLIQELFKNNHLFQPEFSKKWAKIINTIRNKKKIFISDQEEENFSLSTNNYGNSKLTEQEENHLAWSYFEFLIARRSKIHEYSNFSAGKLLRILTKSSSSKSTKADILWTAYKYFLDYDSEIEQDPFNFDKKITINEDAIQKCSKSKGDDSAWIKLADHYDKNINFRVVLSKKSKSGYEVIYENIRGFLPINNIQNEILQSYPFENLDYTIEVNCTALSNEFRIFIVKETCNSRITHISGKGIQQEIGETYDAVVKNVTDIGLFVTTKLGDGLIYKTEFSKLGLDINSAKDYFYNGTKLCVVLTHLNERGQMSFAFHLPDGSPQNFLNQLYIESFNLYFDSDTYIEKTSQFDKNITEKAFCLEQYAVIQIDLNIKLIHLRIAKQLYSNVNNARSYLLNIYISYFEFLQKINEIIENKSLEDIKSIRIEATKIKDSINDLTLGKFPDTKKLILFLEIISHFNEKNDEAISMLFKNVSDYRKLPDYRDLRTIAKISLANNLIVSESDEDAEFVIKNLRFIYEYLSKGVLSLVESTADINARELQERLLYWRQKISEDESELLEFKSSLFTPILNEDSKIRIAELKKQESRSEKAQRELRKLEGDLAPKLIIHSALKTLVAFANSNGGILLIGVNNDKKIIGLEHEYQSTRKKLQYASRDGYGLYFDELVKNYIGPSFSSLLKREFLKFPEGDILIVSVKPSNQEIFLLRDEEGNESEKLYIRNLSSTKELTGKELANFIRHKNFRANI